MKSWELYQLHKVTSAMQDEKRGKEYLLASLYL